MVVDEQRSDFRDVIPVVPQDTVLGPLLFILYTIDAWSRLENWLAVYADDAAISASVPFPHMWPSIAESVNRDLAKIDTWCKVCGMKIYLTKTNSM